MRVSRDRSRNSAGLAGEPDHEVRTVMMPRPVTPAPVAVMPWLDDILPTRLAYLFAVLRNVAVVVVNGFLPFEFGTICEVFGVDRADDRLPSYELSVVAGEPPPVRAHNDFTIAPSCGLERLEGADLIALPAVDDDRLR